MKHKRWFYVIYPLSFFAISVLLTFTLLKSPMDEALARWQAIWMSGAPSYQYANSSSTKKDPIKAKETITAGTQYGELACETAGIRCPIYYGDGEEQLKKGVGTYIGGGLPGSKDVCILGGHDTVYLSDIEQLKKGDNIVIDTSYGAFTYKVAMQDVIEAQDQTQWMQGLQEGQMVLYTCYPIGKTDEARSQRYVLVCDLQEAP